MATNQAGRRKCHGLRTAWRRLALTVSLLIVWSVSPLSAATHRPARAAQGMVATANGYATEVGVRMLQNGGNAVDAAAAVAMALAVTHPTAGNLGGGGFMLIRLADDRSTVIDFREKAPSRATRDMYLDGKGEVIPGLSTEGPAAAGVPGTVAGVALALRKYGTRSFADICRPAERLARNGVILSKYEADSILQERDKLARFPESNRVFLRNGRPYREGELFRQPELAATFRRLIEHGPGEFYQGETARLIVAGMGGSGLIGREDMKGYRPVERQPLKGSYRGCEIVTVPPPSSGGVALLEMLNMLEGYDLRALGHNSSSYLHLLAEVMRRAFADRARYLGDDDYVKVPVAGLIAKEYALARRSGIDSNRAGGQVGPGRPAGCESDHTTHFSVVDKAGNMVACTYTINDNFGSGFTVPGAGFLLNNEMDDFTCKPGVPNLFGLVQGEANAIAPGKRPLSSMTPTIVVKDGRPWFAVGSPGGPRIINAVLQAIVNVVDFGMDLQQAIDLPRIHHQGVPDRIFAEDYGLAADVRQMLAAKGHSLASKSIGNIQGVMIDPESGMRLGASDARGDGKAAGY